MQQQRPLHPSIQFRSNCHLRSELRSSLLLILCFSLVCWSISRLRASNEPLLISFPSGEMTWFSWYSIRPIKCTFSGVNLETEDEEAFLEKITGGGREIGPYVGKLRFRKGPQERWSDLCPLEPGSHCLGNNTVLHLTFLSFEHLVLSDQLKSMSRRINTTESLKNCWENLSMSRDLLLPGALSA